MEDNSFLNIFSNILSSIIIFAGVIGCIAIIFVDFDSETERNKYEAVYSEEIRKFHNCYEKNGYHVCTAGGDKKYIVDKYWKIGKNKDSKVSTTTSKSPKTSKLKFKGMKDNEVKKYVSCNDTKKTPVCTAEDGSKQEVNVYWSLKTKKQKENEENTPIIAPFIVLP